jgi:hypothetical protein
MNKVLLALVAAVGLWGAELDLSKATIVVRPGVRSGAEQTAAVMLVEEMEKRSGVRLAVREQWPEAGAVIAITVAPELRVGAEGFRLRTEERGGAAVVRIEGKDARGALFGAGHLLRQMNWGKGKLAVEAGLDVETAPQSRIRGHQLGYRTTANSWDAWTVAQFESYIRELAIFGANSVENIPFQDDRKNPLMRVPRREMNRAMSEICQRYGQDYWVWTPATVDLKDKAASAKLLLQFDELFGDVPSLTGVFVPGGDPGDNEPEEVLPFLGEIAARLRTKHPRAKVWLSLQGFRKEQAEVVYKWLEGGAPAWFGGIVAGPSSPPVAETRRRLPAGVGLRLYPDITHNKISQYEVPEWDQAYALTLGREAVNPRPAEYAAIHNRYAAMSDGFLSYSDGVHDDVNKSVWSALGWDRGRTPRQILVEYCRFYFSWALAEESADAILALERNWRGPLEQNGAVEATLREWRRLESLAPELKGNWRWQMCLLRANYDAYVRVRQRQDAALELEANGMMAEAGRRGSEAAMTAAEEVLQRAVKAPAGAELRARVVELCERLFQSIGLQTSVAKYHASGAERGAVLDFIDNPLNNRWWLEDEFGKVRKLATEGEKVRRLGELARWENPGEGSFYDDIGNINKSAHVVKGEGEDRDPLFWWWDNGKSRARLSWQVTMWPEAVAYEGLDVKGRYVVRTSGYGQALLRVDGERVEPLIDGKELGEFKEFAVPAAALGDGKLRLTWDKATGEEKLNWRRQSRLSEVWLLKQ